MEKSVKENMKELETHFKISSEQMSKKSNLTMMATQNDLQKMKDVCLKMNGKREELKNLTIDNLYQQLQLDQKYASFEKDYADLESKIQSHHDTNATYKEKATLELFIKKWEEQSNFV